jgi:glutaminyl-peptide cyclotransferase
MNPSSHITSSVTKAKKARTAFGLLLILTLPLLFLACPGNDSKRNGNAGNAATPLASPTKTPASSKLAVDGERAFEHVRKQVEFGPRPAGSVELAKTRDYLVGELKSYGLNVMLDEWPAKTPIGERKMVNVTAELPGESSDVIILSSHYDTKLFKEFRFVGANDGASSTGLLLEMARVMAASGQKPRITYRFVFFDGEEAFCENWEDCKTPDGPDNTYGSQRYVRQLKEKNETKRVRAMILLDMIGYKKLELGRNEVLSTRWLVDAVWDTARELGYSDYFIDEIEHCDGDDHVPFLQEGIESLDIIQLNSYDYWHTAEDTLDKISPQSLKIVGDVVLASLPRIEERLLSKRPAQ